MTAIPSRTPFPLRALGAALGFGLAATLVHMAQGIALIVMLHQPPMTGFAAKTIPLELTLALVCGLVLSPALLVRRGALVHAVLMTALWIGLERWVAIDPEKLQMWLLPPVGILAVYALGRWLATRRAWIPWVSGAFLHVALLAIPIVKEEVSGKHVDASVVTGTPRAGAPDVLFIVMDTVRAKNVSAYGYARKTTPVFDAFAAEGVLFEKATAPATWSLPAHAALFTGTLPSVNNGHDETRYLDDALPTLAGTLAAAGWQSLCFTANPHVSGSFGLTRGFQWEDKAWITGAGGRSFTFIYRFADNIGLEAEDKGGGQVIRNLEAWMADRPADDPPAFVFVNFLEAHFPFHQLPAEYRTAFSDLTISEMRDIGQIATGVQFGRQLTDAEYDLIHQPIVDMYDGGVRYTDALVGRVLDLWRKRGTLDRTIVVILADHGEFTGEHRSFGHHSPVYEEALHVPLAFRYPARIPAGSRVTVPTSNLGVFATLLDLAEVPRPESPMMGSLMPALEGRAAGQPVMAERFEEKLLSTRFAPGTANGVGPLLDPRGRYRTYRQGDWKIGKHFLDGKVGTYLFDLAADPGEMTDLAATRSDELSRMEAELALWEKSLPLPAMDGDFTTGRAPPPKLDAAASEQLKALGYME